RGDFLRIVSSLQNTREGERYGAAGTILPPGSRSFARVADIGRKARREGAHGAKADKPKRYEPRSRLQESAADCPNFRSGRGGSTTPSLALGLRGAHAAPSGFVRARPGAGAEKSDESYPDRCFRPVRCQTRQPTRQSIRHGG